MNNKFFIIVSALLICQASFVNAEDKAPGTGPSPYVDCGIGAALFKDTAWAAVTSNIIWDAGSTAITSATASPETCNAKAVEVSKFINHTYDNLLEDTASGNGMYLNAMLDLYSCNSKSRAQISSDVRSKISKEVVKEDYSSSSKRRKVANYYNIVNNTITNDYAESCAV